MEYVEAQTVRQTLWRTRPPCFLADLPAIFLAGLPQNFGMNTPAVPNKSVEVHQKILESILPVTFLHT
jgi:hypothetical protein